MNWLTGLWWLWQLCRAKYIALVRASNPLLVGVAANIGVSEVLALVSVTVFGIGLGLIWFPLALLWFGAAGMVVAYFNARIAQRKDAS